MGYASNLDDEPARITWRVNRGTSNADYETKPLYFALPVSASDPGFTIVRGPYGHETVTVTNPLDLTGRVFTGSVSASRGGAPLAVLTLVDPDPTDGEAHLAIARAELLKLAPGRYVFDGVFDRDTDNETTWLDGVMVVTGRSSA